MCQSEVARCAPMTKPSHYLIIFETTHQFDIRGLLFATGSGHELGVKEPCQLFVYNSDSACEVEKAMKFDESLKFSQVLLLVYVVSYHGNSSSTYFALSESGRQRLQLYSFWVPFRSNRTCFFWWPMYLHHHGFGTDFKDES